MRKTLFLLLLSVATVATAASTCEFPFGPGLLANSNPFLAGMPLAKDLSFQPTAVLKNIGFAVGYSDTYKNPLWVSYRLFATCPCDPRDRDKIDFRNDPRTSTSVIDDFNRSVTNMDRGHHAPNKAISVCYGTQAQDETYLLTNISPQHRELNEGIWKELERKELEYAEAFGEVWVITGTIVVLDGLYLLQTSGPDSEKPVIPDAFYKIILRETTAAPGVEALAFIFPNKVPEHSAFEDYLRSIHDIETQTRLDFLWQLDDAIEQTLEMTPATSLWDASQASTASTAEYEAVALINEFEANPVSCDSRYEWVEIYNPGLTALPIGGWTLRTVSGSEKIFSLPEEASIPARGFYVFDDPALRLSNGFEIMELHDATGNLVDSTPASGLSDNLNDGLTWSRIQDGGVLWRLSDATRGFGNK